MNPVSCSQILHPGRGSLLSVAWSPDGRRLALGDVFGGVAVWAAEGRMLWRRSEHIRWVNGVSWAPDGRRLASASSGGTVRLWDAAGGRRLWLRRDASGVYMVGWSPDGRRLAWGSSAEVWIVDADSGEPSLICSGHNGYVYSTVWSPDGGRLAASLGSKRICIWETRGGRLLDCFEGHDNTVRSLSWSPDGERLASVSTDKTVRIWNAQTGHCQVCCAGHRERVAAVQWSPLGDLLASGSDDKTVRLWSPASGRELACLEGHSSLVRSVAFSPDGARLASASGDGTVRLWDLAELLTTLRRPGGWNSAALTYIARQAATLGYRPAPAPAPGWVPRLANGQDRCLGVLQRPGTAGARRGAVPEPPSVAVHPGGRRLASGGSEGWLRLWDLETGARVWENTDCHGLGISDVAFSPDGTRLASAANDLTVRIWDTATGRCLLRLPGHGLSVLKVSWSPDGARLVSAADHTVRVWDANDGRCLFPCRGHRGVVGWVEWSPDGRWLASGAADKTVRIWDGAGGECIRQLPLPNNWSLSIGWSPDGRWLAAAGDGSRISIWNTRSWQLAVCWQAHEEADFVYCLAWSPDGTRLASGATDHSVRIWEATTARRLAEYPFPEPYAWRLAWSPDGGFLASSHKDDIFRLWDTREPRIGSAAVGPSRARRSPAGELAVLPVALERLHRLSLYPPLSLLRDLLRLTGGETPADLPAFGLAQPGLRGLIALRWPVPARVGLVALLLQDLPWDDWRPPTGLAAAELRAALLAALAGEPGEPQAPPPPLAVLERNARRIDPRLADLLARLGPEAVAADPGLPLRLGRPVPDLPPSQTGRRRLLALRRRLDSGGDAQGTGGGADRAGLALSGDWHTLLPSQLALPGPVLHSRHARRELLYRSRSGNDPPRLRPAVLVLDISPPCCGPLETSLRLAAAILAHALRRARLPVVLVTAGGAPQVRTLEQAAELAELWTLRSLEPAAAGPALHLAQSLRQTLRGSALEPVTMLLSHPWFGAEDSLPPLPALRGLFVQYPGRWDRPALAPRCERWESLPAGDLKPLVKCLQRLLE